MGPIRWETLRVAGLEGIHNLTELADRIEAAWKEKREQDEGIGSTGWILRVDLCGPTELHRDWAEPTTLGQLTTDLGPLLEVIDLEIRTQLLTSVVRPEDHLEREDVLGEALRLIAELTSDQGPSPAESLGIGVEDMLGLDPDQMASLDRYARQLLSGGEMALLDAFLEADKEKKAE